MSDQKFFPNVFIFSDVTPSQATAEVLTADRGSWRGEDGRSRVLEALGAVGAGGQRRRGAVGTPERLMTGRFGLKKEDFYIKKP